MHISGNDYYGSPSASESAFGQSCYCPTIVGWHRAMSAIRQTASALSQIMSALCRTPSEPYRTKSATVWQTPPTPLTTSTLVRTLSDTAQAALRETTSVLSDHSVLLNGPLTIASFRGGKVSIKWRKYMETYVFM